MKRKILLFIFTLILVLTGITNTNAYDKYDGDYTIEYLLKNYNVVTLGTKERYNYSVFDDIEKTKGSVTNVFDIGGPVLIRGNYTGSTNLKWNNEFAQKTNCAPSYIKGKIGDRIKAGSIESAELSNIYVGSSNKVTEKDGYYTVNNDTYKYKYPVKVSDDYVDFDKLYASIVNEQKEISNGTKINIDQSYSIDFNHGRVATTDVEIYKAGNYSIDDVTGLKKISIFNYDPESLYFITINSDIIQTSFPSVDIYKGATNKYDEQITTSSDGVYSTRNSNELYSGNIILNFPNARYIYMRCSTIGHVVAPKADVELPESHYSGAIIANSISAPNDKYTAIQFYPYVLANKIVNNHNKTNIKEELDINTIDLYDGNYSIDELLKNYSVVTLGQKEYESNTKFSNLTNTKGTARIFHISGQFLINGDLGHPSIFYNPQNSGDYNGIRLDFKKSSSGYNSYIKGSLNSKAYDLGYTGFQYLNDFMKYAPFNVTNGTISPYLYVGSSNMITYWKVTERKDGELRFKYFDQIYDYQENAPFNLGPEVRNKDYTLDTIHSTYNSDNYIDFATLYDAIVEQQKNIAKGTVVKPDENNAIHIPIGGNYTIEGINEASRIVFDNYNDNKNKLTIITINDEGSINFPFESSDTWSNVMTNDWYGKSNPIYGEIIQQESYHGNIVFNIPNATYIKLASDNSFKGHIIAPNADVETPEMNFAGAMICNSLYTERHSEAHFYPLTVGSVGTGIKKETRTIVSEVERITISGTKTWDDNDNQDGLRPESVTINLLANGEKIDSQTITVKDNWKYSFNVPRVDENGVKINYTITENAVEHYATKIESFSNDSCAEGCQTTIDGYNITNSYTPKKTSLTVNKVWKDENNADKLRPKSVEVELYANGEKVSSATLNEENNWTYIFNEIDMNRNGEKIEYTVRETTKLKGYTTEISGDQETGYTITNTHIVKKDNPTTVDNIKRFLMISGVSALLLVICIVIFKKYQKKTA